MNGGYDISPSDESFLPDPEEDDETERAEIAEARLNQALDERDNRRVARDDFEHPKKRNE